jgi:hypothetical protein
MCTDEVLNILQGNQMIIMPHISQVTHLIICGHNLSNKMVLFDYILGIALSECPLIAALI